MKFRKILIRIGLVLLIVITVVLVVRAVLNYTEGRALARTLADLRNKGIPLTAKELLAPCPDSDNAARLWKAAVNLLAIEKEDKSLLGRAFMDMVSQKPMEPADRIALDGIAAKNREALGLLYSMAEKPCFLFRDPRDPLTETITSDAVMMIVATRLMGFDALLRAENGDVRSALEKIVGGLGYTSKLAQEATLISQLIAVGEARMFLSFLEAVCRGREVDDEALLRLVTDLEPSSWRERLACSISGERSIVSERGLAVIKGNHRAMAGERPSNRLLYWLLRPILKDEVRWRMEELTRWERIAREPYFQQRQLMKTDPEFLKDAPWYFKLTGFWEGVGYYDAFFLKNAQLEATFLASRAGLACRLYKSRTGRYPDGLESLVPDILTEVPIDPFTGKPLVYRREGEGFIVYSLGSNQKDDGGRSTYMITQLVMDKDDDWTWKEEK